MSSFAEVSYKDYDPTVTYTNTIVYGTTNCECGELVGNDAKFQFTNYISPMQDAVVCDCGKTTPVEIYDPIITFAGYSSKIAGDRICLGYTVNSESLAIYQEKTNKTLRLGFVVSGDVSSLSPLNVVENEIKSDNPKVLAIEVSTDYCGLDFILSGFSKVDKYDTEIIMNLFTYDGESINYVSIKTTVNDDETITEELVEESSLYTITYNKFAK